MKSILTQLIALCFMLMLSLMLAACEDERSEISDDSLDPSQLAEINATSVNMQIAVISDEYESALTEVVGINFINLSKTYKIDREYMSALNENKEAIPGVILSITYKYADKWKEQMLYFYNILYDAIESVENNSLYYDLYNSETFKSGKEALIISQENWQKSYDSDRDFIGQRYVMEHATIDIFSNFYYNAYRTRAINLYFMCTTFSFIDENLIYLE